MIWLIISALATGSLFGYFCLTIAHKEILDVILLNALNVIVFVGGIEIGSNKAIIKKMLNPKTITLMAAVPLANFAGSIIGGTIIGSLINLSLKDSLLISSGMGWYSFSSVVISAMYNTEIGTMSFIANVLREMLSFLLVPLAAKFTDLPCVAFGGASTMDSTLPVILKYTNSQICVLGFINGLVITIIVPFLITALLSL
jgi:uncharacterized membrane protein YbjE (DUF340 family)